MVKTIEENKKLENPLFSNGPFARELRVRYKYSLPKSDEPFFLFFFFFRRSVFFKIVANVVGR